MPMFSYKCPVCGLSFEKLVSAADKDQVTCRCGHEAAREAVELLNVKSTIDLKSKVVRSAKEVDIVVGTDSAQRWEAHEKRFAERTEGMVEIATGIKPGESFNPERIIGTESSKALAGVYEEAIKSGNPAVKGDIDKLDPLKEGMTKL